MPRAGVCSLSRNGGARHLLHSGLPLHTRQGGRLAASRNLRCASVACPCAPRAARSHDQPVDGASNGRRRASSPHLSQHCRWPAVLCSPPPLCFILHSPIPPSSLPSSPTPTACAPRAHLHLFARATLAADSLASTRPSTRVTAISMAACAPSSRPCCQARWRRGTTTRTWCTSTRPPSIKRSTAALF